MNDSPRNSAISPGGTSGNSGRNRANFADREVLIPKEMLGRNDWGIRPCGKSKTDDCSFFIDAGFNVCVCGGPCVVVIGFSNIWDIFKKSTHRRNAR